MIVPKSLRIGNILAVCYEERLNPHSVEILQADLIHLSERPEADDPRDLIGLPVTKDFLLLNNFNEINRQFKAHIKGKAIRVEFNNEIKSMWLYVDQTKFKVEFIHELQNILFYTTGWEMASSFNNVTLSQ